MNANDWDVNIEARNVGFIGKGKNLVKSPNVVELEPIAWLEKWSIAWHSHNAAP